MDDTAIYEELRKAKNTSADRIKQAYVNYLTQEVKELEEKLKAENLSADEKKTLEEQKRTFEEGIITVNNLTKPTDEEMVSLKTMLENLLDKKYDFAKLNKELLTLENEIKTQEAAYQETDAEIQKLEVAIKEASELSNLQEFLQLHFKALDYKSQREKGIFNFENEEEIKNISSKLSLEYPAICGFDKMPHDTSNFNILKNQCYAIKFEIENLRKQGKDTTELETLGKSVAAFIDSHEKARSKAVLEEEQDFEKNKEKLLIQIAEEAAEIGTVSELNEKITALQKEIDTLSERLKDSEAMLVVNADDETKNGVLEDKSRLSAKEAELKVYLNELKFRNLPDELRWGDKVFKLAMENRKAKLENLSEPEKSQKAKEIAELEKRHEDLYNHDFAKERQEFIAKLDELKKQQEARNQEMIASKKKAESLRDQTVFIKESKQAISDYDNATENLNVANNLDKLRAKAVKKFKGQEFTPDELKAFIENQEEFNCIKDNPDKEQIENRLVKDITDSCKKQKVSNVRKNWKTYAKSAGLVAAGIATGLVLSSVPGVGTVRMIFAGAKLAGNVIDKGINIYNSKHNYKEPIRTISKAIAEEAKKILPEKIQSGLKKIDEKLKYKNINLFINGVSVGYIAGNLVEIATGKTVFQNIADKFNSPKPIIAESNASSLASSSSSSSSSSSPDLEFAKVSDLDAPTDVITSLSVGDVYDLSNIPDGYVYSGSNNAVKLLTQAGKAVTLDKKVTVNGKVWCSFLQPDGKGYAWIPEDVVKSLGKVANEVGKGLGR